MNVFYEIITFSDKEARARKNMIKFAEILNVPFLFRLDAPEDSLLSILNRKRTLKLPRRQCAIKKSMDAEFV